MHRVWGAQQCQTRKDMGMAAERFPVESSHIMMFARSIGDPNPIYSDEEYAKKSEVGGIIAPPTFPQASAQFDPDYVLRPKIGEPWFGSGKNATGVTAAPGGGGGGGGGLHASQKFEFKRPIRAGDVLTVKAKPGNTWEKEGKKGGKLLFSEHIQEFFDQNGELVVTVTMVGVQTSKVVTEG